MKVRIARFCGAAAMALCLAGPALAREAESGGVPVSSNTMMLGNPLAAGPGNPALQRPPAMPGGTPFLGAGPLVSTNTQVSNNIAAGLGNAAVQQGGAVQSGAPMVGLDFSGRGPLVTTNVAVGTNLGAGLGNLASQTLATRQR